MQPGSDRADEMLAKVEEVFFQVPELHPGCTGCLACLLVCPDFVFEVYRYETPQHHEVTL